MSAFNTTASLAADIIRLGLRSGAIVMVHSSLGRIGWTDVGPVTAIEALLEVIGARERRCAAVPDARAGGFRESYFREVLR